MKISPAQITFNEQGTPTSSEFDDVYFSNNEGQAETSYVFLEGNVLFSRWQTFQYEHFCIGETGFGTGLNFFCVADLFLRFKAQYPNSPLKHLHFISTEKYPIPFAQLPDVLATMSTFPAFPENWQRDWLAQYPESVEGVHRIHFHPFITVDIHYNDASEAFSSLYCPHNKLIDAWFLDGFAPSKNSSMWSQSLFDSMAFLSKENCTLATFTAAGFVKRGLVQAGFNIRKQKGFGRKREMIVGDFNTDKQSLNQTNYAHAPYFSRFAMQGLAGASVTASSNKSPMPICVVGNGLAGAISALKLVQLGYEVELIWSGDLPADAASGALIGGFYPQLNAQNNIASRIQLTSFLYAKRFYDELNLITPFEHSWCGALQLGFNDNTKIRLDKLANKQLWPESIAHPLSPEQASEKAKVDIPYPCLFMPLAGWISPVSLVNACINTAKQYKNFALTSNTQLLDYAVYSSTTGNNHGFSGVTLRLQNAHGESEKQAASLVICAGSGSQPLLAPLVPLRVTRGQVEWVKSTGTLSKLNTLLCHKGYLSPALNGLHALGSTYVKEDTSCEVREEETQQNFALHMQSMQQTNWVHELTSLASAPSNSARAGIRCSSPDHIPVVGAVPNKLQLHELKDLYKALPVHHYCVPSIDKNVYVLSGLGSRGLTTAPLMAEILVSEMLGRPLPLPSDLLDALSPNRFIVRSLIRREPLVKSE